MMEMELVSAGMALFVIIAVPVLYVWYVVDEVCLLALEENTAARYELIMWQWDYPYINPANWPHGRRHLARCAGTSLRLRYTNPGFYLKNPRTYEKFGKLLGPDLSPEETQIVLKSSSYLPLLRKAALFR